MLEVKKVSKLYENQRGVRDIDFSMSRGEIVGFLGPNGAGKTTTMRMITGYLNPTSGSIKIDGMSMADHPKKARQKIGYLPETPPLYHEMSVIAYLKFIADLRGVPAREQKKRIEEVIDRLGLQGREKQVIRSLSKGYKQRVGLAQAILHNPDLLIMDEPTSGLDPKQIIEIRQLIRELGQKHTVLLSTHILPEINTLCNRVLIINQGQIVMDGHPAALADSMGDTFEVSLEVKGPRLAIVSELRSMDEVAEVKVLNAHQAAEAQAAKIAAEDTAATAKTVEADMAETAEMAEAGDAVNVKQTAETAEAADATDESLAAESGAETPTIPAASETAEDTASPVRLLVTAHGRQDIREALFYRMAEKRYPILSMKRESLSLEDIFLKLTTNEQLETAEDVSGANEEVKADA